MNLNEIKIWNWLSTSTSIQNVLKHCFSVLAWDLINSIYLPDRGIFIELDVVSCIRDELYLHLGCVPKRCSISPGVCYEANYNKINEAPETIRHLETKNNDQVCGCFVMSGFLLPERVHQSTDSSEHQSDAGCLGLSALPKHRQRLWFPLPLSSWAEKYGWFDHTPHSHRGAC